MWEVVIAMHGLLVSETLVVDLQQLLVFHFRHSYTHASSPHVSSTGYGIILQYLRSCSAMCEGVRSVICGVGGSLTYKLWSADHCFNRWIDRKVLGRPKVNNL